MTTEKEEPKKRGKIANLLIGLSLVLTSFAVVVLLVEVGMRLVYPQNVSFMKFDSEIGWTHRQNAEGYYRQENETPSFVSTDSHGLRTPSVSAKANGEGTRILILGDSFVAGLAVGDDATFSQRLEKRLNERHPDHPIEVINAGIGGYSPLQEMLLLERVLEIYEPDLVVQVFYAGNDFYDNADPAGGRRPIGKLDDRGELVIIPPRPRSMFVTVIRDSVLARSHFAFFLRSKVIRRFRSAANAAQYLGLATYGGLGVRDFDLDREREIIQKTILRNQETCSDQETTYALAVLASPPETKSGPLMGAQLVVDEAAEIEKLEQFAESAAIPVLDLKSAYREASEDGRQIYVRGIGHFTDYGHDLTADVLTPFVEELIADRLSP